LLSETRKFICEIVSKFEALKGARLFYAFLNDENDQALVE